MSDANAAYAIICGLRHPAIKALKVWTVRNQMTNIHVLTVFAKKSLVGTAEGADILRLHAQLMPVGVARSPEPLYSIPCMGNYLVHVHDFAFCVQLRDSAVSALTFSRRLIFSFRENRHVTVFQCFCWSLSCTKSIQTTSGHSFRIRHRVVLMTVRRSCHRKPLRYTTGYTERSSHSMIISFSKPSKKDKIPYVKSKLYCSLCI